MKNFLFLLIVFLLNQQDSFALFSQDREIKIYKNIRCLACQGQSLNDSNSDFANDLKKVIKEKLNNNETDQEIYTYLTARYGDWILFDPPVKKSTLLLWFFPVFILVIGIFILYKRTVFEKSKLS
ncbi:MAG: cytochrome c-type biogenesis protein CcmH [Proteobacteria bacterium]|jgi:cytochrome c-type biogenesis protein CcmH|nr:cytochrome c-type biogenesis protein CcmH [Pseudomonadota bacterium]